MVTRNRQVNIISDSCCDLPADLYESLGIGLLKFPYLIDDVEYFDDLYRTITPHQFYERLRKGEQAKTAQIPYVHLLEVFEKAAQEPLPTVFLCFTSGLSGNFVSVQQACAETMEKYPEAEMYVVDTLLPSIAEGLLVWEAVRQADRGLTAKELVAWAEEARYFVNSFFTIPDLESLRRGGRIPDIAAMAGTTLDIKPIIAIDLEGRLKLYAAARGRKKSIKLLLSLYEERAIIGESNVVIVASADAPKELKQMTEQLLKKTAASPPVIISSSVGTVIGAHVGPDMIAISFWGQDRREYISLTDRIAYAVTNRADTIKARIRNGQ
ncbi:MAG: DegV family protein [Coriobacteriia bacterium]|nr:DegV family protein [Coriobacteriia bacterium]